ncbi:MAG: type II toxin-antitoxin system HipA family toxin [Bacteroidales bacterium]|nr:type II toxin-antitoxin system HipA family toxin [Bacteroidales bacterium]
MIDRLDVYLWGKKVGTLVAYKERYTPKTCFYFDREFARNGYDIAPLRAPSNGAAVQTGLPVYGEEDKLFGGLPSFIADSLPDHWGNRVFTEWARSNNIKSRNLTALDRLAYIGRRGMGALEFVPPVAENMENPFKVEIESLYELAKTALLDAKKFKTEMRADIMFESLFKVGTSAGGRRPKAIINVNLETGECYSGQVSTPIPGFTPMLIKFYENLDVPTTQIEYAYYLMACDAGLKMMPSRLIRGSKAVHFLTERFDRRGDQKIHVQTLAAMNPRSKSYGDLFDVACGLRVTTDEMKRLFLQMTLNVLAGNVDDHNKNFSFLMGRDGVWHVSPAHDFTFTVDLSAADYVNCHSMSINGKVSEFRRNDLLEVAKKYNICRANTLIDNAIAVVRNFRSYALAAGIDDDWTARIQAEIDRRLSVFA